MSVVLVALIAVAAVAGAWWWAIESAPPPAASTAQFTYVQTAAYDYVAHLRNNSLYPVGNLTDPSASLFYEITTSLSLAFVYHLAVDRPVNVSTQGQLAISLVTPAWSKAIGGANTSATADLATGSTLFLAYDLNVSGIVALESAIENETGYHPQSFAIVVTPTVDSVVRSGPDATHLGLTPTLTLNFTDQRIVPGPLTTTDRGQFVAPNATLASSTEGAWAAPLALGALVGALGAAGGIGYLEYGRRPRRDEPDLEALVRPYAEAIARTETAPPTASLVRVRGWDDLVRVADTIGRPILRYSAPRPARGAPSAESFYVLSDSAAYLYDPSARAFPTAVPAPSGSRGADRTRGGGGAPRAGSRPPPGEDRGTLERFASEASRIRDELEHLPSENALRGAGEDLLLDALGDARRGRYPEAWRRLSEAAAVAGGHLERTPPRGRAPLDAPVEA